MRQATNAPSVGAHDPSSRRAHHTSRASTTEVVPKDVTILCCLAVDCLSWLGPVFSVLIILLTSLIVFATACNDRRSRLSRLIRLVNQRGRFSDAGTHSYQKEDPDVL